MNKVLGFNGTTQLDASAFYCPYIPLQVINSSPRSFIVESSKPKQEFDHLTYRFNTSYGCNDEITIWLINECKYDYILLSFFDDNDFSYKTYVIFSTERGSVDFKLRWL